MKVLVVSLESRAPLLDKRIVEFAFNKVPGKLKVNFFTTKYLLKKLAEKWLPKNLNINRKQGFGIPISDWFRKEYKKELNEILLDKNNIYFQRKYIKRLLDEHLSGVDHGMRLFAILVFILWHDTYCN